MTSHDNTDNKHDILVPNEKSVKNEDIEVDDKDLGYDAEIENKDPLNDVDEKDKNVIDEEGKYQCDICNKSYPSSLKLYYHKRNHKPKKFEISVCEFCNKCFPTKKQMIAHRSKFHKVEQQCEVCDQTFFNKIKFWQHMKVTHTL